MISPFPRFPVSLGMKNFGAGPSELQVWNRGWAAVDVQTLMSRGIDRILTDPRAYNFVPGGNTDLPRSQVYNGLMIP